METISAMLLPYKEENILCDKSGRTGWIVNYFRWYSVPDSICRGKEKGVTVHHRNPWFSLWWRRGDLNSRPPPCEGDALPAELLPHMDATTRRSEVCMPFTCRGQVFFVYRPPVGQERRACYPWHARAGSYEVGSGSRRTCLHQWPPGWEGSAMPTARASCFQSVSSLVCRQASSSFLP